MNTRGLPDHKWRRALELVEGGTFDLLFLLETWHVDRAKRRLHPRLLAATEPPVVADPDPISPGSTLADIAKSPPSGRHSGGVALLVSAYASALVLYVEVSPLGEAVTVSTRHGTLTGLYLPPSMPEERVAALLASVSSSDIILGDVNVRLPGLECQYGTPGPKHRLATFRAWLDGDPRFTPISPERETASASSLSCERSLNWDHCFARRAFRHVGLSLPSTKHLGIDSDHEYALSIVLGGDPTRGLTLPDFPHPDLPRYRIRSLGEPKTSLALSSAWERCWRMGSHSGIDGRVRTGTCRLSVDALGKQGPCRKQRRPRRYLGSPRRRGSEDSSLESLQSNTPDLESSDQDDGIDLDARPDPEITGARPLLGEVRVFDESSLNAPGGPSTVEDGLLGSISLYKQAARSSFENGPLLPTEDGLARRMSALEEVSSRLAERFTSRAAGIVDLTPRDRVFQDDLSPFTTEEVAGELALQDTSKACGADGVHVRVLRQLAVSEPTFLDALTSLYNACFASGATPAAWNDTLIYLLVKDVSLPKDADNVRPITLVSVIRKVFERLLLSRFDLSSWAAVHPLQAGFKARHSTYMNAAAIHALLESGLVSHVAFLDFRSAFDVVDHAILAAVLRQRGCPPRMLALIAHLTFDGVRSTVLSDGGAGPTFVRGRGVLQGSPLSPHLFNIFVDSLLRELEAAGAARVSAATRTPTVMSVVPTLFYADDGTLLASSFSDLQRLIDITTTWCSGNKMELNVKKCSYLASSPSTSSISPTIAGSPLPRVDEYTYLGFPVTPKGVDFRKHLTSRIEGAAARASFLAIFSDGWGPAHRLRVYRTYLAPMFEYGAPLVAAHAETDPAFYDGTIAEPFSALVGWIAGGKANPDLTANLLGLEPLESRFRALKAMFQLNLRSLPDESPLKRMRAFRWQPNSFYYRLTEDALFRAFAATLPTEEAVARSNRIHSESLHPATASLPTRVLLRSYLFKKREEHAAVDSQRWRLTRVIPQATRLVRDLRGADLTLKAPRRFQANLLHYRRGVFAANRICLCPGPAHLFHRGHEVYASPVSGGYLSLKERALKHRVEIKLPFERKPLLFTDVDFLLNRGEFTRAHAILQGVLRDLAIKRADARATKALCVRRD